VQASCIQGLPAVRLGFAVLRWSEPEAEGVLAGVPPFNKLAGSSDLVLGLFLPCFFLSHHGGGDEEEGGMGMSHRFIYVSSWSLILAASGRGIRCRSVPREDFFVVLLYLMVEGRPLGASTMKTGSMISSRPLSQKGGSFYGASTWYFLCLPPVLCWWCCSHSSAPSGFIPGDGGIGPGSKPATRTRWRFSFVFWGPFCKMLGLCCNFLSLLGPHVKFCMLI